MSDESQADDSEIEEESDPEESFLERFFNWLGGAIVGVVGLGIVGAMFYFCIELAFSEPREGESRFQQIVIAYALGFVSVLGGVACARLIIPALCGPSGRVIDPWMMKVLGWMWLATAVGSLVLNPDDATLPAVVLILGILTVLAVRSTLSNLREGRGESGRK